MKRANMNEQDSLELGCQLPLDYTKYFNAMDNMTSAVQITPHQYKPTGSIFAVFCSRGSDTCVFC